jgi:hypothetical protein
MNPFQSIANYLDNDLYRWETDEERKNRYDEMYPMGDAHLGHWDFLDRRRVRMSPASGYQQWDEGAEDTGPAGYDASVQENVLETITKRTPTGTTITKKLAPTPERQKPFPIARGLGPYDEYAEVYRSMPPAATVAGPGPRGMPPVASPAATVAPARTPYAGPGVRGFTPPPPPSPDVAYPFEGSQGTSMRQGGDMMHALALQAAANNQRSPSAVAAPPPRDPYSGPGVRGFTPPPPTYPDAGGMDYQRRSINDIRGDIQAEQFNQARAAQPAYGGPGARGFTPPPPTYPDAGGMQLQNRNEGQIRADLEAERNRISRLERQRAMAAKAIPQTPTSDEGYFSPDSYINDMTRIAQGLPSSMPVEEPITGDVYTDAVIDFVGRGAEADEKGMGDWYSQMAREAIRKFNKLPTDEKVTPVYKKKKTSGLSRRTMNKGTTSSKKKKQRSRGRRY